MALPLLAIGMGLQAGSSLLSGFFGSNQKKNEAAVYKYNAAVKREEAEAIKKRTKFQLGRWAEKAARIQGYLEASVSGSGTVTTQGALMLALALQKTENDLQNYLIGLQGRAEANQALSVAGEYDMMKQMARIGAKQAMIGGILGAGASAMSSWGNMPKKVPQPSQGSMGWALQRGGTGPHMY